MAEEINIDGTNMIVGRMGAYVAKKALLGNKVNILNAEKAVFSGRKEDILKKYHEQRQKGGPFKGPFIPRLADKFLKRTFRGMLPHKKPRGKQAYANIKCYIGVPEQFKDKKLTKLENPDAKKLYVKSTTVEEVCNAI